MVHRLIVLNLLLEDICLDKRKFERITGGKSFQSSIIITKSTL